MAAEGDADGLTEAEAKSHEVEQADIIEKVYQKIGFSKKEASELVEMVFDQLKTVLQKGDKVKISGFGNFIVRAFLKFLERIIAL